MQTNMPGKDGPPYAMIPSYITEFQSSPVRICGGRNKWNKNDRNHEESHIKTRTDQNRPDQVHLQHHYLKHCEQRLGEVVKGASSGLVKVEFPSKELHAEQGEDDDEEEEQEQQGSDGAH